MKNVLKQSSGSMSTGPSKAYLRLLRGEITAKQYVKGVKKVIDRDIARAAG